METLFILKNQITSIYLDKLTSFLSKNTDKKPILITSNSSTFDQNDLKGVRSISDSFEVIKYEKLFNCDILLKTKILNNLAVQNNSRGFFLINELVDMPLVKQGDISGIEYEQEQFSCFSFRSNVFWLSKKLLVELNNSQFTDKDNLESVVKFAQNDEGLFFYYFSKWKKLDMQKYVP